MNVDLFVQNVKQLCAERGISPTAACKESGVGTSFIPDIKRGHIPSIDKFEKLALYLGVTISQLIGDARNSLVVMQYSVPPKDTIEEVYEILDMIQPKLIHDFKSYINSTDPPISASSKGPYTAFIEAQLQNFDKTNTPTQAGLSDPAAFSADELSMIKLFRSLPSEQQEAFLEILRAAATGQNNS